jgi:hypothetical protein
MNKILKIAAALAVMGTVGQANAAAILIDPDGAAGGAGAISVTSLNWLAGNVLTIGAGGSAGQDAAAFSAQLANGTAVLRTVYQAQLNTFVNNTGGSSNTASPVGQWTIQADFSEYARALALGAPSIALTPFAGTVSIFYNATAVANDVTGTGYNAGIEILRGSITAGSSGSFLNSTFIDPVAFPVTGLDQFGADDAAGVQSVRGSGQSTIKVDIDTAAGGFVNTDFFLSNITSLTVDAVDTGQLVAPFFNSNPSDQVVGITPTYGSGNMANGTAALVDPTTGRFIETSSFHFQSTNVTSFNAIPEPASMAITGLGLGLMSLLRRRKAA